MNKTASLLCAAIAETGQMVKLLCGDFESALTEFTSDRSSQWRRRSFVRTALGFVEAMIAWHKNQILLANYCLVHRQGIPPKAKAMIYKRMARLFRNGEPLSMAALAVINEEQYGLDQQGRTVTMAKHVPLPQNIRFTLNCYAKCFGISTGKANFNQHGWDQLQKAIKIRNRITHPRKLADIEVSEGEMRTVTDGVLWFMKGLGAIQK